MRHPTFTLMALLAAGFLPSACLGGGPAGGDENEIPEAVIATFRMEGETFKVRITSPSTIADLQALAAERSEKTVPSGPLVAGPGEGDHNLPWSWHMDPDDTVMANSGDDSCSATPSEVEADLEQWLAQGQYCPEGAELIGLAVGSPT